MARKALLIALALTLALAAPAMAQKKSEPKTPVPVGQQASVSNFGQRWSAMTDKERDHFLEGMIYAIRMVCTNAVFGSEQKQMNMQEAGKQFAECIKAQFPYKPGDVKTAMTTLYQDKANNIVPFDLMYGMALLKIKGDPYEENLSKLRKDLSKGVK